MQQPSGNGQITRAEFEARHASLAAQVAQNEARYFSEQAAMKVDLDRKFDRMITAIEGLRKDFVTQPSLEQQLNPLREDIKEIKQAQLSRQELLVLRLAGFGSAVAALVAIVDLLLRFNKP